ncbi:MAG TPA: CYTH domain-containing protein, partial [Spirochaetales bacterium]|nr:CYTH domain-containing protein [Spirochaetales bacterium]
MIEVELKAHVHNMSLVRANVAAFAEYVRDFDKFDSYWHGPDWRFARGTKGFRVRKDSDTVIVTYKTKRNESGIEINKETEFTVSDIDAFLSFISRIGCEPFYQK